MYDWKEIGGGCKEADEGISGSIVCPFTSKEDIFPETKGAVGWQIIKF